MFENVESAYHALAESILDFIKGRKWDMGVIQCEIYEKMASSSWYFFVNEEKITQNIGWPSGGLRNGEAAIFLRDHLLDLTGDRIWGLTFTLYPDGKFKIEYDYEKPEGYEESNDVITGDEINESLSNLKK